MLWTDERISRIAAEATSRYLTTEGAVAVVVGYMMVMRDEYEAQRAADANEWNVAIAELEAELQRYHEQEAARF